MVLFFPLIDGEVETWEIMHLDMVEQLDFELTWAKTHLLFSVAGHLPEAQYLTSKDLLF